MYAAACKARFDFSSGSHTKFTFSDFGSNLSNFASLVLLRVGMFRETTNLGSGDIL